MLKYFEVRENRVGEGRGCRHVYNMRREKTHHARRDIFYGAVGALLGVGVDAVVKMLGTSDNGSAPWRRGPRGLVRAEDIVRARELLQMSWVEYGRFLDKLLK